MAMLMQFHVTDLLSPLNAPGNHDDDPGLDVQGHIGQDRTYLGRDLPVLHALAKHHILAITSGHDHGSNWCARSERSLGLMMCMNGHSG